MRHYTRITTEGEILCAKSNQTVDVMLSYVKNTSSSEALVILMDEIPSSTKLFSRSSSIGSYLLKSLCGRVMLNVGVLNPCNIVSRCVARSSIDSGHE